MSDPMTNWNEMARELLIKETGRDIGNSGVAYLCYGIEESIERVAKHLEAAYNEGVREGLEDAAKITEHHVNGTGPIRQQIAGAIRARREESA